VCTNLSLLSFAKRPVVCAVAPLRYDGYARDDAGSVLLPSWLCALSLVVVDWLISLHVTELLGVRDDFFGMCMSCVAFVPSTGDGVFVMCPKNWKRVLSEFVFVSVLQSVE